MAGWIAKEGPDNDIVLSSRVRLARNIKGYPFPQTVSKERGEQVLRNVSEVILQNKDEELGTFEFYRLGDIPELDRYIMVEQHLISPSLIENLDVGGVIINSDKTISIMINEEDHLRIQCILPGLQLEKEWFFCDKSDDLIEDKIEYAFDENIGYLTSCPTNVGTGLRASVMMHLPALVMTGEINRILQTVTQIGFAVRGLYGEGTDIIGNVFQLSNQITLGHSERDIIKNLEAIVRQIMAKEKQVRNEIFKNDRARLEDRICRSFGILSNARIMTSQESMKLLSDVRLGVDLDIIKTMDIKKINSLMVDIQPACLQKRFSQGMDPENRDIKRAELIRSYFN